MPTKGFFTNTKHFWDSQSLFGKHLLGLLVCFIGLPAMIVLGNLGFTNLSKLLMFALSPLVFWTFGFWYVAKGAWRLLNIVI